MGLFDKLKKKAQEQIESAGMSDILQNQKDAFRYAMKNGGYSLLGSDAAEKIAAFKEKEEAEKRAKEETERLRLERIEAERLAKIEAERLAKIEAENKAKEEANRLELERIEIERKAKEEADRAIVEEAKRKAAAAAEVRAIEEAERLAQIESERRIQEEIDRKAIEDVERRIKAQNDLRVLEETERKLKEEEQQRLAEAQKQQDKVLDPIREYVEKAESGDAQAACQIGLWFQHGQKGLPCDKEQAKYWYQQSMVLGNPNAASFLNMLIDEEKKEAGVKAQKEAERIAQEAAEEVARLKQEEEKRKRLMYNSEDEYLACENNDGEAALRVGLRLRDEGNDMDETPSIRTVLNNIELLDKSVMFFNIAKVHFPYGKSKEFNISSPDEIEREISVANCSKKFHNLLVESMNAHEVELEKIRREDEMLENRRRREREEEIERKKEAKKQEQNIVTVVFRYETGDWSNSTQNYYTTNQKREKKMPKEEYYSLIQSGEKYLESYVNNTFEDGKRDYCHKVSLSIE